MCIFIRVKVKLSVAQSCPTLCDPMDYNPPGSSVHGVPQARILEWIAISFSKGSFPSRDRTRVSCIVRQILYRLSEHAHYYIHQSNTENVHVDHLLSIPCFLAESESHSVMSDSLLLGILQARIVEWIIFPFSRGSSQPRSPTLQVDSLPAEPQGKPKNTGVDSLSLL